MSAIYFLLIYSLGVIYLYTQGKKKNALHSFFPISLWTLASFAIYLSLKEIQQGTFYISIPCCVFLLFLLNYQRNKTLLVNGFLFNLFLLIFGGYLFYYFIQTRDWLIFLLLSILSIIVLLILFFGTWSFILLLYWNSRIVVQREGHSIGNLLSLILAITLTCLSLYDHFFVKFLPDWFAILSTILPFTLLYFSFMFVNFMTISFIYQFNRPKYHQDFIIVLGAGLQNGDTVTPLLAQRIDRALAFYNLQKEQTGQPPKIIFSGGQGADELIPEAVAMKNYALDLGYPSEDLLTEEQSTTTFENMKFSKEIIEKEKPEKVNVIFSSNNYHLFRAGVYARNNQLKADGIGSKTALYYLPTAFLREFIAIIAMHRKGHFLFLGCSALFFIIPTLITYLFSK